MLARDFRSMWIRVNQQGTVAFSRGTDSLEVAVLPQPRTRYARVIVGATRLAFLPLLTLLVAGGVAIMAKAIMVAVNDEHIQAEPTSWFIAAPLLTMFAAMILIAIGFMAAALLAALRFAGMFLIGGITVYTLNVVEDEKYLAALYRQLDRTRADRICAEVKGMSGRDTEAVVIGVGKRLHELSSTASNPKIAVGRILTEER